MKSDYGEGFLKQKFRKKSKVVKAMVTLNADSENKEEIEDENEEAEDKQKTLIKDLDAEEYDEQHMLASKVTGLIKTLTSPAGAGQMSSKQTLLERKDSDDFKDGSKPRISRKTSLTSSRKSSGSVK